MPKDESVNELKLVMHELDARLSRIERKLEDDGEEKEVRIQVIEAFIDNIKKITTNYRGN